MNKPSKWWEITGLIVGFGVAGLIAVQAFTELFSSSPSTLSPIYLAGFFLIHVFWSAYGIVNNRIAIWLSNLACGVVQMSLIVIVFFNI